MTFNINEVPFSRYGSYFAFMEYKDLPSEKDGVYLKTVHADAGICRLLRLELTYKGEQVAYRIEAVPHRLRLISTYGHADICIYEPQIIRIKSIGVGVRFIMDNPNNFCTAIEGNFCQYEITYLLQNLKLMLTTITGSLKMSSHMEGVKCKEIIAEFSPGVSCDGGLEGLEAAVEEVRHSSVWNRRKYSETFEECSERVENSYEAWLKKIGPATEKLRAARELAAYVNWSAVVNPAGAITRAGMYMSKSIMTNIWSWDHCFNAMALVKNNPHMAWDQFMIMFDNQDNFGALPDTINDKGANYCFCKPPIHGWALAWMMKNSHYITHEHLMEVYEPLVRWTDWWFLYRDSDKDGIPQYNHGFDSGWDNCTAFDAGFPLESPDLSAYLIIQMDTLHNVATILGKTEEAESWRKRADSLLCKALDHFWRGDRFVAMRSGDHHQVDSQSLFLFLPLVLGKRLPEYISSSLVNRLKDNQGFITRFGLATENIDSPSYIPDGYWRGPIWAPPVMLIVDGLMGIEEKELAVTIAKNFCNNVAANGMAENFDAETGVGLRDRAYTWTSSIFMILSGSYF